MVKYSSGDILLTKWRNGETVILTFVSIIFHNPTEGGDQAHFLTPSYDASIVSASVLSRWCCIDLIIVPWAAPTTFDVYLPPTTINTGGGGFVPFCNLLILAIAICSDTGNILYYLCDNVTYKTFASAVWSLHDRF